MYSIKIESLGEKLILELVREYSNSIETILQISKHCASYIASF